MSPNLKRVQEEMFVAQETKVGRRCDNDYSQSKIWLLLFPFFKVIAR